MTNVELAESLAVKLRDCVIPHEYETTVRLMLLHLGRVCGDPHFEEEARLLIELLNG